LIATDVTREGGSAPRPAGVVDRDRWCDGLRSPSSTSANRSDAKPSSQRLLEIRCFFREIEGVALANRADWVAAARHDRGERVDRLDVALERRERLGHRVAPRPRLLGIGVRDEDDPTALLPPERVEDLLLDLKAARASRTHRR